MIILPNVNINYKASVARSRPEHGSEQYGERFSTHKLYSNGTEREIAKHRRAVIDDFFNSLWPSGKPRIWRDVIKHRDIISTALNLSESEAVTLAERVHANLVADTINGRYNLANPITYLVPSDDPVWNILYDMRRITSFLLSTKSFFHYGEGHTISARFRRELRRGTIVVQDNNVFFRGTLIPKEDRFNIYPYPYQPDYQTFISYLEGCMANNEAYEKILFSHTDIDEELPHLNHHTYSNVAKYTSSRVGNYVLPFRLKDVLIAGFEHGILTINKNYVNCQGVEIDHCTKAKMINVFQYYGMQMKIVRGKVKIEPMEVI